MHPKMKWTYVGIDSHKETHCAVFLDCFFGKIGEITFNNVPSEFDAFLKDAQKFKIGGTNFAFGLEDTSAYGRTLTVFLTGKKELVKHANSSLVASERNRRNTLHKTDSFDAECAARVLLNSFEDLPIANPQDKFFTIQSLVARRDSVVKINAKLKSQLHHLVMDNYPNYKKMFPKIDTNIALTFFENFPSPNVLVGVTSTEVINTLKYASEKRIATHKIDSILEHISKSGFTASEYQGQKDFIIASTVRQIKSNLNEIDEIEKRLESFLTNFDYKLTSMKGLKTVIACKLIAEIGDIRRFDSPAKLARYAGVAPVTYSSGKSDLQFANERGNRELNQIFFGLAINLVKTAGLNNKVINHYFHQYYHKKLAEGKTTKQAIKCVQRRLVNIIYSMMKKGTEYINPQQSYDAPSETEKNE